MGATDALAPALAHAAARRLCLCRRDLLAAAAFQFRRDVAADPLPVPPLHGQDRDAVEIDAEVQVVAAGEAGLAGLAEDLALLDLVADLDVDRAQVAVERVEPEAVVEDHRVAVDAEIAGEGHRADVARLDRVALGDGEVIPEV